MRQSCFRSSPFPPRHPARLPTPRCRRYCSAIVIVHRGKRTAADENATSARGRVVVRERGIQDVSVPLVTVDAAAVSAAVSSESVLPVIVSAPLRNEHAAATRRLCHCESVLPLILSVPPASSMPPPPSCALSLVRPQPSRICTSP